MTKQINIYMRNITVVALSAVFLLASCGEKGSDLNLKKSELDKLKKESAVLLQKIAELEMEIAKLDTAAEGKGFAVRVDTLKAETYKNPVEFQGVVESDKNVAVSSETGGTIVSLSVKEGDMVIKGQVLATLDGSLVSTGIDEIKKQLELAEITYDKQKRLWEQNIGSEIQYLQAKNRKEALEKQLASAQTRLGKYVLRAPISGTVDRIMFNTGEMAGPGMPVVTVVDGTDIKIRSEVSEGYIGKFKKGDEVLVKFPSIRLQSNEKINAIGQVINPDNRTYSMYVVPSAVAAKLKPNLLAIITAYDFVQENAITVPTILIQKEKDKTFVFVAVSNGNGSLTAEKRYIEIEHYFSGRSIVKSGLKDGDLLITAGYNSVDTGDKLKIVTE